MPLHPQVVELLEDLARTGGKPMEEASIFESRAGDWAKPYIGEPEEVASVAHRFFTSPTADIAVRIYTPEGEGPFPAVVWLHGSAWCVANIEKADVPHRAITNRTGCVVVAVNYQKAPEHRFPTALGDAYAAVEWVIENADELGVDPTRVGVGGDSAGGNLAAAVCLRAKAEGGPAIAFQVLVYPAVQYGSTLPSMTENAEGYMLTSTTVRWAWDQYVASAADGDDPLASPLRAPDLQGLPPAVVLTAEFDPLRDEGEAYARRLQEEGVPTTLRRYDGMIHGFLWTAGVVDGSKRLIDDIGHDVRAVLDAAR
jgi:acetyl esterase